MMSQDTWRQAKGPGPERAERGILSFWIDTLKPTWLSQGKSSGPGYLNFVTWLILLVQPTFASCQWPEWLIITLFLLCRKPGCVYTPEEVDKIQLQHLCCTHFFQCSLSLTSVFVNRKDAWSRSFPWKSMTKDNLLRWTGSGSAYLTGLLWGRGVIQKRISKLSSLAVLFQLMEQLGWTWTVSLWALCTFILYSGIPSLVAEHTLFWPIHLMLLY